MNGLDEPPPGEAEVLDDQDVRVLGELRALYAAADPLPADLAERIVFAVDLADVDAEVGRLVEATSVAVVRGVEQTRTLTFDSGSMTIMVSLNEEDGRVRIDGWLAPPGPHTVELRTVTAALAAAADERGRFVLTGVPHGLAQLLVTPAPAVAAARAVITPSFTI